MSRTALAKFCVAVEREMRDEIKAAKERNFQACYTDDLQNNLFP